MDIHLTDLIQQVEAATPDSTALNRITEAQIRAHSLNDVGDQLVGYFVSQAKEAGASWSQIGDALGVSKQAAQQRAGQGFNRFTDWARHAVVLAQESARSHQHNYIGTEHLLLGVLGEPHGLGAKIIAGHAGSLDEATAAVTATLGQKTDRPPARIPFNPAAKQALEKSMTSAEELGHDFVGTEHVLLGLMLAEGPAHDWLAGQGLTENGLRLEVVDAVTALLAERAEHDAGDRPES